MNLKFFNTLSHSIEVFEPLNMLSKNIGMYCCGPTVYDYAHIGNFRTFIFSDIMRRVLEFKGFKVKHVMNITDVDDKIIHSINTYPEKITLSEYTKFYEDEFFKDFDILNCIKPTITPRATEYIPQMIELINKLVENGIAYQTSDGNVFFSIKKYINLGGKYGQLSNVSFKDSKTSERIKNDNYEKENVADFALWKARVESDGDIFWKSPWGDGRPGWHIECSAMSRNILGETFDLHVGGEDLMFPHHEDEIAQSEGSSICNGNTPKQFVKYWIHFSHLLSEGKKMSKSLGNFYMVKELLEKGYTGREIRYLLLSAHYREPLNFTIDGLNGARTALFRLDECLYKLNELKGPTEANTTYSDLINKFDDAISNDFNLSSALAVVFEWIRETNKKLSDNKVSSIEAANLIHAWKQIDSVLAIGNNKKENDIPNEILTLVEKRNNARKIKNFKQSDIIRDELKSKGWIIEDTPTGTRIKRI